VRYFFPTISSLGCSEGGDEGLSSLSGRRAGRWRLLFRRGGGRGREVLHSWRLENRARKWRKIPTEEDLFNGGEKEEKISLSLFSFNYLEKKAARPLSNSAARTGKHGTQSSALSE